MHAEIEPWSMLTLTWRCRRSWGRNQLRLLNRPVCQIQINQILYSLESSEVSTCLSSWDFWCRDPQVHLRIFNSYIISRRMPFIGILNSLHLHNYRFLVDFDKFYHMIIGVLARFLFSTLIHFVLLCLYKLTFIFRFSLNIFFNLIFKKIIQIPHTWILIFCQKLNIIK